MAAGLLITLCVDTKGHCIDINAILIPTSLTLLRKIAFLLEISRDAGVALRISIYLAAPLTFSVTFSSVLGRLHSAEQHLGPWSPEQRCASFFQNLL